MTETFNKDLFNFAKNYTNKCVSAIINHAEQIKENDMLCDMLHELTIREAKEEARFEREFGWYLCHVTEETECTPDHFDTYRHDCHVNAQSYRDVIRDYIWKIIECPF